MPLHSTSLNLPSRLQLSHLLAGGENGEGTQGQEGGDTSAELLTQQGSLQEAVFGVLYTLSKERLTEGCRFVVFAMVLDYLQVLEVAQLDYNLYLAIFFVLTGFLLASAALCVFVGINFKRNQFPYVWPIKVLKLTVSFFFELFYISTLGIFIVALDCTYYNAVKVNELLAMAMAYFIAVANSELDPLSEELNSQAHNRSALKRYALISLITIINEVFPSYTKIQVALLYRMALKSDGAPVTHKFVDELEVEIVARCGRIRDKYGDLMPAWVDTAEAVYKAGLAQFPHSSYLHIAYSSFLISRGAAQAGAGLLEVARKLDPSIGERFMIFVRDREQKQRGGSGADGSSHDLLSYVEFQTNFNALMDVHRHALKANRSFWRQLVRKDIAFNDLTRAFATMEAAEKRADSTFKMSVKSNPTHAARYRAEATRLEKAAPQVAKSALIEGFEGGGDSEGGGDRSMGAMMSDSNDAASRLSLGFVVVINDAGIIQFVNKKLLEMFGYKQGQLQGKNVSVLAPPPFSNHHSQYLQRLKKTGLHGTDYAGKATLLGKPAVRRVALHAQGFSFPVTLAIKELQQGDAKAFVGVFKPASSAVHEAQRAQLPPLQHDWCTCRDGFTDAFGYCLADLRGELAGSIGTDDNLGMEFRHISQQLDTWQYSAAEVGTTMHTFKVSLKHKYGAALTVSGSASFEGTENVRLVVLKFALDEGVEKLGLISMTGPGQIVYVNEVLEKMLGYEPGKSSNATEAHSYIRTAVPSSCCTGRIVVLLSRHKDQVPVRLRVVEAEVGNTRCLTASVTEVSVPEADAWGGGDVKELCNSSKRMLLLVHGDGRVLAFKADPATALQGFGQDVAELCGKDISAMVQDFSKPSGLQQDWPSVPQLLSRLSHQTSKAHAAGVAPSFRVDVLPCLRAANERKQRPKGASADSASTTIPCRMVVLPLVEGGAVSGQDVSDGSRLHVVELRRDDLLEVVLEVDPQLRIKAADSEAPYLFGSHALEGKSLTKFLRLPADGRSERSADDATSNNDGTSLGGSDMAGGHHASDHQRAKRFHRLDKMLSSPKAQQMIRTLKWASIVMVLLLVSVHALFFGLTIKGINDFQQFFDHVVVAGEASTSSSKASQFEASSRRLVFGSSKKLQVPATAELENLFIGNHDGVSIKELSPTRQYNASLWDLSQRFATAGRLIAATAITPAGAALANSTEVGFLISNRDTVAANVVQTINFQQAVASVKIAQQTKDIIIFLIAEAGGLIPVCCLGLYVLLTLVHRARIKLFSVFLAVPRPVVMQLATREVQVSADADDGDDEESDTWLGQQEQQQGDAGSGAVPGTGVGFNLTASKRTLRTNGLAAYVMMSPFILWGILVCVIYAVSIVKLRGTTAADTHNGLNHLVNMFLLNGYQLQTIRPAVDIGLGTPQFDFLWNVSSEGQPLEDGLMRNTANFVSDGQGQMTVITILQVLTEVVGVLTALYVYFKMLLPFLQHSKRESRRVAELLAQLPAEMNVEYLVLSSTNQEEEDGQHPATQAGLFVSLGRLFGCCGRGRARVSPNPRQASETAKLNIVVSQNTSKDNEAPTGAARDVSAKYKTYTEKMQRHHSEESDLALTDPRRLSRKVSFS
ncbi:hypothetical protein N2152v2_003765 [Parachlorella kessleri]